ncbi:hypothetical protein N9X64_00580 [bacterium]|nr:hypothetical protein [bacterium]
MEKLPKLSEEEIIARAERRAIKAKISKISLHIKLMLDRETELLQYLKEDIEDTTEIFDETAAKLGGTNAR